MLTDNERLLIDKIRAPKRSAGMTRYVLLSDLRPRERKIALVLADRHALRKFKPHDGIAYGVIVWSDK